MYRLTRAAFSDSSRQALATLSIGRLLRNVCAKEILSKPISAGRSQQEVKACYSAAGSRPWGLAGVVNYFFKSNILSYLRTKTLVELLGGGPKSVLSKLTEFVKSFFVRASLCVCVARASSRHWTRSSNGERGEEEAKKKTAMSDVAQ